MCAVRTQGAGGEISFTSSDSGAWATVYNITMCALCIAQCAQWVTSNVKCVKWTLAHQMLVLGVFCIIICSVSCVLPCNTKKCNTIEAAQQRG